DTPWEALGSNLRDANRDQADHLWAKLAISELAGAVQLAEAHRALARARRSPDEGTGEIDTPLKIVRDLMNDTEEMARLRKPTDDKPNAAYDEDLVELLAKVEHRRWMASKIMAGWQHGETRNDRLRRHNCLVDYDALSEIDKEKDRDTARSVPTLLEMAVKALSGS
ncbi:MAG: RyR domain-containing protein, partial [Myxococcota bacterium]|nr:RyR domain-containing protein [Myxococcota bacterium]